MNGGSYSCFRKLTGFRETYPRPVAGDRSHESTFFTCMQRLLRLRFILMIGESVMHTKELGDLLVEANIITTKTLDRVLAQAQKDGKQFGTVLEEMGIITDDELVE